MLYNKDMAKKKIKRSAKKKAAKKSAKKGARRLATKAKLPKVQKPIGEVTHFYNEIGVAIVKFKQSVPVGTLLYFKGATTDFKDIAKSIQYDHAPIAKAPKGKQVGIKVKRRVRPGDKVHFAE